MTKFATYRFRMGNHGHLPFVLGCGALLLGSSHDLKGSVIRDQAQRRDNGGYIFTADSAVAQTFTAGVSGQLAEVDVWFGHYGVGTFNVTLQVVETAAGAPSGLVLGSVTQLDPASGWDPFDFSSAGISLQQGSQYGIVLADDDSNGGADPSVEAVVWWSDLVRDVYPNGALWDRRTGDWAPMTILEGTQTGDMAFQTWMSQVPEPGSVSFLLPLVLPVAVPRLRRGRRTGNAAGSMGRRAS